MQTQYGIITRVIGIVHRWAIQYFFAITHGEIVRNGDCFIMRDQKTMKEPSLGVQLRTRTDAPGRFR